MDLMNPYYRSGIPQCLPDVSTDNIGVSMGTGRAKQMTASDKMLSARSGPQKTCCQPDCRICSVQKAEELFSVADGAASSAPFTFCEYDHPDMSCHGVFDPTSSSYAARPCGLAASQNAFTVDTFYTADSGMKSIPVIERINAGTRYPLVGQYVDGNLSVPYQETTLGSMSRGSTELEHPPVDHIAGWANFGPELSARNFDTMERYASIDGLTMTGPSLTVSNTWPISTSHGESSSGFDVSYSGAPWGSHTEQMPTGMCQDISNFGNWPLYPTFADPDFNTALDIKGSGAMFADSGDASNSGFGASADILSYADRYPLSCKMPVQNRQSLRPQSEILNSTHRSDESRGHRRRRGRRDKAKDEFLLACKAGGQMSYKAIKEEGGFDEAVSTLRGRYRTLTKSREARVRKPKWTERDISVLKDVVKRRVRSAAGDCSINPNCRTKPATMASRQDLNRVPWKEVAETMTKDHGCYRFGNATVKKKYLEVMGFTETNND